MKVRFTFPMGSEGWTRDVEMPAAPRQDDHVDLAGREGSSSRTYLVRTVVWYPDDPEFDVYVVVAVDAVRLTGMAKAAKV